MLDRYLITAALQERLAASGLIERIEADDFPHVRFSEDSEDSLWWMTQDGYFRDVLLHDTTSYRGMAEVLKNPSKHPWTINGEEASVSREDLTVLSGAAASYVLEPEEFWDAQRWGFATVNELFGALGAHINTAQSRDYNKSHRWVTEKDGKTFKTEMTGDMNGDFRVFRHEITEYETIDPLGVAVGYRPLRQEDKTSICAYHSVEVSFLISLMRYIDHQQLDAHLSTQERAEAFVAAMMEKDQYAGNFADFGMEGMGARNLFIGYETSMQEGEHVLRLNSLPMQHEGSYIPNITGEGNLAFDLEVDDGKPSRAIEFFPEEIDELIQGIFTQTQRGLGRTSMRQLAKAVEYRFSDQFVEDRAEEKDWKP